MKHAPPVGWKPIVFSDEAGIAGLELLRRARRVGIIAVEHGVIVEALARPPGEADPLRPVVAIVELLAGDDIGREAVALLALAGDAQHQFIGNDRDVEHPFIDLVAVIAVLHRGVAVIVAGRPVRLEQHGTTGRVAAEQRALRPFQHLDIGQVEIAPRPAAIIGRERHLAEIGGDVVFQAFIGGTAVGQAADRVAFLVAAGLVGGQRRHQAGQVLAVLDTVLFDRGAADRADRDRHLLDVFLMTPRRNGDLFDLRRRPGLRCRCRVLRRGRQRGRDHEQAGGTAQHPHQTSRHSFPSSLAAHISGRFFEPSEPTASLPGRMPIPTPRLTLVARISCRQMNPRPSWLPARLPPSPLRHPNPVRPEPGGDTSPSRTYPTADYAVGEYRPISLDDRRSIIL